MNTEENQSVDNSHEEVVGEGSEQAEVETISISKAEFEKLNQTLGSLKRENKDLKKPKEELKETPKSNPQPDNGLLEKAFLRTAGISAQEEVELALNTAKKWGVSVDVLVDDEDFKIKLDKLRTQKSNELATSNIRGSAGQQSTKATPEYWIAKGVPPTPTDVPDRKTRAKIVRAMMEGKTGGKKFYND